jgi:chemotaxis protein CheZ
MEKSAVSDMSVNQDALDQLDERVRRLGSTLKELGWDVALHQLVEELPDVRERLVYVGQMTETAAMKVLDLVDLAQPACRLAAEQADGLAARLQRLTEHPELGVDDARAALAEAATVLQQHAVAARAHAATFTEIMLAQDFQDLSGQVIKKVVRIIGHTEQQLLQLLAQGEGRGGAAVISSPLQGPQVPGQAAAQQDVDDLLASLGF